MMNERIEELIKQAGISVDASGFVDPDNWVDEPELKMFAELIIQECARVQAERSCVRHGYDKYEDGAALLQHFGVSPN